MNSDQNQFAIIRAIHVKSVFPSVFIRVHPWFLLLLLLWRSDLGRAQVEYVDPTIGSVGWLLEPTRPTVQVPHSMVRVYPVRRDQLDDQIRYFPLSIISHRLDELFWLMPCDGEPNEGAWTNRLTYDEEKTTPYCYSVRLGDSRIRVEFTSTERCGYFRFTFPSGKPTVLLANNPSKWLRGEWKMEGDRAAIGIERFTGMRTFCYGEFSTPVTCSVGSVSNKGRLTARAQEGQEVIEFRYGISFIGEEQAKKNLRKEIPSWSFAAIARQAKQRWNDVLGQVQVEGGTPAQKRVFYTALYRCSERMICVTEDGQYWSNFDRQVHQDPRPFYVDNWLWDTYQALEPLHMLLNPEMEADKLQSYVRMYEQSGWMPSFAVLWGDYAAMTGNHAAPWMADAWFKGLRNFDLAKAYEGLRKNELEATMLPWNNGPKLPLDDFYAERGYYPALRPDQKETERKVNTFEKRQAVAVTLQHSYDDWCIAQLARELGNEKDHDLFQRRAGNYKNVFRAEKGFMWPKDADGAWVEPFDPIMCSGPGGRDYFTENNAYTYNWDVKHDYRGLFELMGGPKAAEQKLDDLFRTELGRPRQDFWYIFPDSSAMVGQFSMGNEPSFGIPYLYNYTGAPWKTQKRIRMLLETWFTDGYFGIPGDEDGGGMSSFAVFSMMGFYPVTPGVPIYNIGSPVFDRVTIHLKNGRTLRVVAKNNSRDNKYVQSIRINGQPSRRLWFRHADIVNGGTIELRMGNVPNRTLGTEPSDFPPSAMEFDPRTVAK